MHPIPFLIISCYFIFATACSWRGSGIVKPHSRTLILSHKAVFKYLQQSNIFIDNLIGKGQIKIDPLLFRREMLTSNGKVYFKDPMYSSLLKHPLPDNKVSKLIIPDSLRCKYDYTNDENDYEHDYSIIHQFSPLLPTIIPDIFLMEHYVWGNACHETGCVRLLNRSYLKFKVDDKKVTYLDDVLLIKQTDFIGFGSFSRKKMEEALPGEKIAEFGW